MDALCDVTYLTAGLPDLVTATGPRELRSIVSPLDGRVLGSVPVCTADDVVAAARLAREAQRAWADQPLAERAALANRFRTALVRNGRDLLDLLHLETGKSRQSAFEELGDAALAAAYYAQHGPRHLATRPRMGAIPGLTRTVERSTPVGVVGIIAPWNYPLTLAVSDAIAALVAGNAVILKPDSLTPLIALSALRILRDAGMPQNLMQIVTGAGRTLGTPLIENVDFLMFTGSSATGATVAAQCGARLIGCSAELGGKNPMLVLADADVERAAHGAIAGCFANTGQLCVSIERIYVHRSIYDAFVSALASKAKALKLGAGRGWDVDLGSLVSSEQLAKVVEQVEDAVAKGATVLAGGRVRPDLGPTFFEPTVLTGVTSAMALFRSETFGPVVSVYPVATDAEAIAAANDTDYGLNASVWSRNVRHARRVARSIRAGTVNINEGYAAAWGSHGAPIGGMGISGLGRRHGREGILKYTEPQTIAAQHLVQVTPPEGATAREGYVKVLEAGALLLRRLPVGLPAQVLSQWLER